MKIRLFPTPAELEARRRRENDAQALGAYLHEQARTHPALGHDWLPPEIPPTLEQLARGELLFWRSVGRAIAPPLTRPVTPRAGSP